MKKRLLSALLTFCMLLTLLPVSAFATGTGTQADPVTNTSMGVTVNKYVSGSGTTNDPYKLTLEAFASNKITSTTTTTPLDIVLVLDVSGSMGDSFTSNTEYTYTPYSEDLTNEDFSEEWRANNLYTNIGTDENPECTEVTLRVSREETENYELYGDNRGESTKNDDVYDRATSRYWPTQFYTLVDGNYYEVEITRSGNRHNRVYTYSYNDTSIESRGDNTSAPITLYIREESERRVYSYIYTDANGDEVVINAGYDNDCPNPKQEDKEGTIDLYSRNEKTTTTSKLAATKTAVNAFITQVTAQNENHRIALVKFASDAYARDYDWEYSVGDDFNYSGYNYTQTVVDFTNEATKLTGAVDDLQAGGATAADYGLSLASEVFAGTGSNLDGIPEGRNSKKVVVFFTDGVPTYGSSWSSNVAENAVDAAYDLKQDEVTVYSVGVFSDANPGDTDSNFNRYMNAVSSNYPNAYAEDRNGFSVNLGNGGNNGYYFTATDSEGLNDVFEGIADTVTSETLTANPDSEAVLTDTLSEHFDFPTNMQTSGDESDVAVRYVPATAINENGVITWGAAASSMPEGTKINVTVMGGTIKIDGFNYRTNAVTEQADGSITGGKLVVTFPIELDDTTVLPTGGNLPTNATDANNQAGLKYKLTADAETNNGSTLLTESPTVNVPAKTYTVTYEYVNGSGDTLPPDLTPSATGITDTRKFHVGGSVNPVGNPTGNYTHEELDVEGIYYQADDGSVWEFAGWAPESTIMIAGGVTFTGTWNKISTGISETTLYARYLIEHYLETDEGYVLDERELSDAIELTDQNDTETVYARNHVKTYTGYTYNPFVAGSVTTGTVKYSTNEADAVVLKLYYDRSQYTVTYDLNGGTIQQSGTTYVPLVYPGLYYGDETPVIPEPTKVDDDGHYCEFIGWDPTVADTVTEDVTYVAQYERTEEKTAYTVTYFLDGEEYGEPEEYRVGEEVIVLRQVSNATPWETDDLEEGAIIGGGFTMPANDVVFTATTDGGPVTPPVGECTYSVTSHYIDRDGDEIATVPETGIQNGVVGTPVVNLYSITNDMMSDGREFVYDRATLNGEEIEGTETLSADYNEIDVYYDIDEIDEDDPETPGPDGIPDRDQIVFTYRTEDTLKGVLKEASGSVEEIVLVATKEQNGSAYAPAMTAYANTGYEFDRWEDDTGDEAKLPGYYQEDTTFTAYFKEVESGEQPTDTVSVIFLAENGTFNGETTYTATVEASVNDAGEVEYLLTANDLFEATPDEGYGNPTWTHNYEPCSEPTDGTSVEDWDIFVVTFHPVESVSEQVTVTYQWDGQAPEDVPLPSSDEVLINSNYTVRQLDPEFYQIETDAGVWYFLGWYDEDGNPYGTSFVVAANVTLYGRWEFQENTEEQPEPTPEDERFLVFKYPDQTSVTVGDTITWTITIASMCGDTLTLAVDDQLAEDLTYADGTPLGDTITLEPWHSVDLSASYQTTLDDVNEEIVNVVVVTDTQNPDDPVETEADPVDVVEEALFTLTYNANGGRFGNDEETFTVPNLLADTYTLTETQGYTAPTNGNYVLIGWSENASAVIGAGEEIPGCITEVTLSDKNPTQTVYAVWGEDANDDGIADAQQIVIRPADITIYTGGDGYEGVVNGSDGEMTGSSTNHGLPEPGYYLVLPYDLNEDLREDLGVTGTVDLSQHLRFTYGADRIWELELYNPNSYSMAYDYYIYQMVPQVAGQDPVRLEIKDGDTYVTDDDFTIALDTLYQEYEMKLYTGEVEASGITVQISVDGENWADVGRDEADGICTIVGTLTVRGTNSNDPTTSIESSVTSPVDVITAEAGDVTYYINDSDIPVVNQDDVALLSDELVGAGVDTLLAEAEDRLGLAWYEDYEYQSQYLDLVDTSNGNAYVTLGAGDSVDIHWPMPNGTSRWNTEFYVVHFDGLDRNFDDLDAQLDSGNVDLQVYTLGDGLRIENGNLVFTTDTFSPFVLIWQDSDRDWPDDDDDDDNDRPSHDDDDDNDRPEQEDPAPELDKESHIAYVSGTPEGTIEPNAYITREEVATIFFRLLTDRSRANYITDYNPFPDVDSSRWSFYPIVTMNNAGIMHGYDDGNFAPSGYITRAEFAVVAAQFSDAEYTGADLFSDISGHWAREYINRAASEGWISGYPDGSFGPDDYITRAQVMALVNEVLDRAPDADYMLDDMITWPDNADESAWYYEDVQEATNSHSYVWRNSGRTSEEWEDLIDTRTLDELVRDAFNGVGISY